MAESINSQSKSPEHENDATNLVENYHSLVKYITNYVTNVQTSKKEFKIDTHEDSKSKDLNQHSPVIKKDSKDKKKFNILEDSPSKVPKCFDRYSNSNHGSDHESDHEIRISAIEKILNLANK